MRRVAVVGVGHGKFGKRKDATLRELAYEAVIPALEDAGITQQDVEAAVVAIAGEEFAGQGAPSALVGDYTGIQPSPVFRVESACASGTAALKAAYGMVSSGLHDIVMAIGVEKMNAVSSVRATELMARAGDTRWEYPFGVSFPGFYALFATRHMHEYGTTKEHLAMVGVKNHYYGAMNPVAHLPKEVSLEEAVNAVIIAWPLGLYDCCLISDGGAAAVLMSEEKAKEYTDTPIWITGIGSGSDTMMVAERPSLTSLTGVRKAAKDAYNMAGIGVEDVDVAEVHDCFTIAEIMAYEDLGFCKPGEGGTFIEEKQTYIGGKIPVNVDGGLKSKGHPIGATGVSQCYELVKQLRGECDRRQVDGAEIGLSHNVGQTGQFANVIIYSR
ncbi:MAG: thiolase domain-containing protein [Theionarchaea archaeon]|nr:thiolase domain-containing protein [Theionarchaea archaeon]